MQMQAEAKQLRRAELELLARDARLLPRQRLRAVSLRLVTLSQRGARKGRTGVAGRLSPGTRQ